MITMLWQSLVTGVIVAAGFALYMKLAKGSDLAAMLRPAVTVGALAALISFAVRAIF